MADSTPLMCPGTGPCSPWDATLACLDDTGDLADSCIDGITVPPVVLASSVLSASQVTWALTGRQFSTCDVTIRPCRRSQMNDWPLFNDWTGWGGWPGAWPGWSGPWPVMIDGAWFNLGCGCGSSCSCRSICEVALPYPVCDVNEVVIDGVVLDPTAYRVDNFRMLVRTDGECWPICQNMALDDSQVGTWSVSLTYGKEPPQLALDAAGELACELMKARLGQTCRLPQRMSSLTRQGITMSFLDPMTFFKDGRTGLYMMDLAIRTFNPKMLARAPGVFSPDVAGWRVTTS